MGEHSTVSIYIYISIQKFNIIEDLTLSSFVPSRFFFYVFLTWDSCFCGFLRGIEDNDT